MANIGSCVNREVHAQFWERAEVKCLRATRPKADIRSSGLLPREMTVRPHSAGRKSLV
jgi:hypothetical protein